MRLTPMTNRESLTADQQRAFDHITGARGSVGTLFALLLHRPELARISADLGGQLRFASVLPPPVRESVMLAVATLLHCEREQAIHGRLALEVGVEPAVVQSITRRQFGEVSGDIGLALEFAAALVEEHRVSDELFDRVATRWSDGQVVELTALVGYYSYVSCVLNAFDVPLDDGLAPPAASLA